jgi:hypothetical protein
MKLFKKFLRQISTNEITYQHNISRKLFINKMNHSNYYHFKNYEMFYFFNFINTLSSDALFTVVPIISIKGNPEDPYMVLGRTFLVSSYSFPKTIFHHIHSTNLEALEQFNVNTLEDHMLVFKYKKVVIDIDQLNKKYDCDK